MTSEHLFFQSEQLCSCIAYNSSLEAINDPPGLCSTKNLHCKYHKVNGKSLNQNLNTLPYLVSDLLLTGMEDTDEMAGLLC